MRIIYLMIAGLLCSINGPSQGIVFVKNSSWQEVLSRAKASGKIIFVDMYTDWCGPCKRMDKEVFILQRVGDTFNANFINYKMNAEKGEGVALKRRYRVISYPTYLFIRGDGTLVYKAQGAMAPDRFIAAATYAHIQASKPSIRQLDSLYAFHKKDKAFLYTYLRQRTVLGLENADLLDTYFRLLSKKEQRMLKNLQLVVDNSGFLHKSLQIGPAFRALMRNSDRFSLLHTDLYTANMAVIKKGAIKKTLGVAIAHADENLLGEVLQWNGNSDVFDNDAVVQMQYFWGTRQYDKYTRHAISYVDERLMRISDRRLDKMDLQAYDAVLPSVDSSLASKKDWTDEQKAALRYTYKRTQTIQFTNAVFEICRNIIRITKDTAVLKQGLSWMNRCIRLSQKDRRYFENVFPVYLDMYACFLYVLGKKADAIEQEQKAIDWIKGWANSKVPEQFALRLSRMRNKEKLYFHE